MSKVGVADASPLVILPPRERWRHACAAASLGAEDFRALSDRAPATDGAIYVRAGEIIARVRRDGDRALFALARELDGVSLDALEVSQERCQRALDEMTPALRRAMQRAAANIARVHTAFLPRVEEASPEPGIVVGRRPDPLGRVGVYAPGGRAVYPSSVLMGAIPARVAGVGEIVLCTPPTASGEPSPLVLAAAALARVDRVFAVGGAGAIAAMAYGTATIPPVDRVIGPGNAFVAAAKLQVAAVVAIDSPAGPSELLIVADETSDAEIVAREVVGQAEHDPLACVVVLVVSDEKAGEIAAAVENALARAPRRGIIEASLAGQGALLTVRSLDAAIAFANRYAPEHLLLAMPSEERCATLLPSLRNVGTVFVGESASNAFGDYMTGANHVLPTGGLARSYSGLSVLDFVRWTTYQRVDREAAARLAPDVAAFADAEGLPGHALAARAWIGAGTDDSPAAIAPRMGPSPRREVAELPLLEAEEDRVTCEVDVSDNTNLWGMPPAAARALRQVAETGRSRYPSAYSSRLRSALGSYLRMPDVAIVTGCGSDDVLDLAMRAYGRAGESIAFSTPTFSMIPVFARLNGLTAMGVPLRDDDASYDIDADRLLETRARIIYLCAPNNPTGTGISRGALEHVLSHAQGLVILDEAYAEFAASTHAELVRRSDRLLVTRTFSKAFGLAGLRVGYGVGQPSLVSSIERARGPYKVNTAAECAALAALEAGADGADWVQAHAALARISRERLTAELRRLGLEPLPSEANFVLVPLEGASEISRAMLARGVRVRVHTGLPRALAAFARSGGEALRISVGPAATMNRVVAALEAALA